MAEWGWNEGMSHKNHEWQEWLEWALNESNHHSDVIPVIPRNDEKWHFQSFLSHSNVIPIIPGNDENWHFKSFLSHSDAIPVLTGNDEEMAFQVIPGSFLDRMIKGWVQLLRKCFIFLAIDNTVLWKNCAKIQQLSRVSTFRLQINAPNGTFTQLFWRTHYKWRTRFEWRTHRVDRTSLHYQPTPLVPRPRFGLRANPSSGYLEGGTLVWTLPKRTSPQPTRGDVQLKI